MTTTIKAGVAMVKILESWGIDHIYGMPGGSINSTIESLRERRDTIRYIGVRHEETGAIAASVDAKLNGRIGACMGSAGPGATHLFNGLYDAQMDHVPVLALVGQVASTAMNFDSFQELNENPMFADVSVYNRTVMTPESLPHVVDEAIRRACEHKGVAVVTMPVDFPDRQIPEEDLSSAHNHRSGFPMPDARDVAEAVRLLESAERPVLYVGQGTRGGLEEILALSRHYGLPIVTSVLARDIVPDAEPNLMGTAGRVASKPANEALALSDLILFIGSDFPFVKTCFPKSSRLIQVDVDSSKLGRRHFTDVAILGDARETMRQLRQGGKGRRERPFLAACVKNRENWQNWLAGFATRDDIPLRAEPVFREINRIAGNDAVFVTDVGNVTIHAVRHLELNGKGHRFTTSGMFATMGYGVPGGLAAKLSRPESRVFTLCGDGGFAMTMQDVITQAAHNLPVINVVFSNNSLGFIEAEQEDTGQPRFGVLLDGVDFAKAGEAMGAKGFRVTRREELPSVFDAAKESEGPVVIDVKIENKRPFPAEAMIMDPERNSTAEIRAFCERYEVRDMPILRDLLAHG